MVRGDRGKGEGHPFQSIGLIPWRVRTAVASPIRLSSEEVARLCTLDRDLGRLAEEYRPVEVPDEAAQDPKEILGFRGRRECQAG